MSTKRQLTFPDACWQLFSSDVTAGIQFGNISAWSSKGKTQINESTLSQGVKERTSYPDSYAFESLKMDVLSLRLCTTSNENCSTKNSEMPERCLSSTKNSEMPERCLRDRKSIANFCVRKSATQYLKPTSTQSSSMHVSPVRLHNLDITPPRYVLDTLALGPKNAVIDHFNHHDLLAELDLLLNRCQRDNVHNDTINEINMAVVRYIKICKNQRPSRKKNTTFELSLLIRELAFL